ncbi:MAG: crotonase/enoyl-CoA hydratase family protein [Deltaproteobacteria bacterium]|nr:crotonase/enoyl-CoA hydratase family protein [Deltaproteobacteria bacterium]
MKVIIEKQPPVFTVVINRPEVRNAVDRETAELLFEAFEEFEKDESMRVAVLWGEGGNFCAGADLKAISNAKPNRLDPDGPGPMGPSRMILSKPVIAAVSGYAVAGGLELACWCDLRIMEKNAIFGVFCRRWGVPLIDGGTVRLARLIGVSHALDMILTGRAVHADDAYRMGLANMVVDDGRAKDHAQNLAAQISQFPQVCLKHDRLSLIEGLELGFTDAMANEFRHGMQVIQSKETVQGATRFKNGSGRHGTFDDI